MNHMTIKQYVEFLRPLRDGAVTEFYTRMASQALPPTKYVCVLLHGTYFNNGAT